MRSGEDNGTPLQYFCLENLTDGGAWWAAVHGVAKSWTRLRDFPFIFHFHALEKEMPTHSSVLAWRIPGMGEPGRLPSMGLHRVGHNWSDLAAAAVAFVQHTQKGKPTKKYSSLKNLTLTTCKEDQRGHLVLFDGYLLFILLTRTHRFCSSFWFHQHQEA